ncbi:MAG TPA: 30S ribosomal protein S7 [Candidatus Paceibacterota bacterium]|nr:30S ribosomal protein S7 [Candidatus Paceibacterota bacterium]
MRRKINIKRDLAPDVKFQSEKVSKLMNYIMYDGKKNQARTNVYKCFEIIKEKTKSENPLDVFEAALKNTAPNVEVRSRRVGGANYQVPVEVRPKRKDALSIKWIIDAARAKKGAPISAKLADEIIAASKNEGEAVKKRENTHKMAEANKAFAHFAW